jgi:phage-related protein
MFIWNNISSDDMDLITEKLPEISISIPKSEEVEVDGRDGHLTQLGGYESDTKEVDAHYIGEDPYRICSWLRGSGEVTFGNDKDFYYKAMISNKIPLEQLVANKLYYFPIMFRCQPFKYFILGKKALTLTTSGVVINNHGNYESLPIMTISGNGNITVSINSRSFVITGLSGSITIVSEIEQVLDDKGELMEGAFPYFDVGKNVIHWSGNVSKINIIPNWRCL